MWKILDPNSYGLLRNIIHPAKKYKCIGVRFPMYNMKGESHDELLQRRAEIITRCVKNCHPCMTRDEFYALPTESGHGCRYRMSEEDNRGAVIDKRDDDSTWLTIYNLV